MKTIPIILGSKTIPKELYLGFQGENEVTCFQFDYSNLIKEFGKGSLGLIHARPYDKHGYPCELILDGNTATWTIYQADTKYDGIGECQLTYIVDSEIKKTQIFKTKILKSIGSQGVVPQAYTAWVNQVLQAAAHAQEAKDAILDMTATAEISETGDTPGVTVTKTTIDDHFNLDFNFANIKGEKGDPGKDGVTEHNLLDNLDFPNQHPIEAIIGLQDALDTKLESKDLASVAFTGEMNDLKTTLPSILYCGTSTEVVDC